MITQVSSTPSAVNTLPQKQINTAKTPSELELALEKRR